VAARRKADTLIGAGRVTVNGVRATVGQRVRPGRDRVAVDGREVGGAAQRVYWMLNKPVGVLTTVRDDRGRATVVEQLQGAGERLFPVGRLDLRSRGLVLMTNDGELAVRLMHPRYHVEKEYRVLIGGAPAERALQRLRKGMQVGEERFGPASVEVLAASPQQTRLRMVLREGRKREVRRMWRALGHAVLDLERVRIGPLRLDALPSGQSRALTGEEVRQLRKAAGLP
jgi:23S rRNA pseudouridine2605 synthase